MKKKETTINQKNHGLKIHIVISQNNNKKVKCKSESYHNN